MRISIKSMHGEQAETAAELHALPPSPRLRRTGLTSILDKAFNSESVRESQANCDGFAQPLRPAWRVASIKKDTEVKNNFGRERRGARA